MLYLHHIQTIGPSSGSKHSPVDPNTTKNHPKWPLWDPPGINFSCTLAKTCACHENINIYDVLATIYRAWAPHSDTILSTFCCQKLVCNKLHKKDPKRHHPRLQYGPTGSPQDPPWLRNDVPNRSKINPGILQGAKWCPSGCRYSPPTPKIMKNQQKHKK